MLLNYILLIIPSFIYKLALIDTNQCISNNSWSIHGLWPDYKNGSYPQFCNLDSNCNQLCSRYIKNCSLNVSNYIHSNDLLYDMNQYWCSEDLSMNNQFWCHEWCKHGCCIKNWSIPEYFDKGISLFKSLSNYSNYNCYNDDFLPVNCS